jgi:hypothetical protein
LELYRTLVRHNVWPSEGELKVATMAFEDLIRGRSIFENKPCCRRRVPAFKLPRSLCLMNLRIIDHAAKRAVTRPSEVQPGEIKIADVPGILARRAIAIYKFTTENQGVTKEGL